MASHVIRTEDAFDSPAAVTAMKDDLAQYQEREFLGRFDAEIETGWRVDVLQRVLLDAFPSQEFAALLVRSDTLRVEGLYTQVIQPFCAHRLAGVSEPPAMA